MSAHKRLAFALLWLALLALAGWLLGSRLELSGDLRKFMPSAQTPAQKLLIDELGEGPGSRLLLVAISHGDAGDGDAQTLAAQSNALRTALAGQTLFKLVANGGDSDLAAIPERLRPYRYLLSPTVDTQAFDRAYFAGELAQRVQDLGSPAATLVEPLLPRDPTLETLKLADAWQPAAAPQRLHGVWFDRAGREALLAVETRAAGFDPQGQQLAVDAIRAAFAQASGDSGTRLTLSGPGAFSVEIGGRTAREAGWIGTLDSLIFVALLWLAYRSWKAPLLGGLPLASGGLAGLAAVTLLFDGVHGITIAFGFTLIGVAQDYPIHLFSHQRAGLAPWANARALWPTLGTGVASTCIAYFTFLVSGVDGLEQLAVFTVAGLGVAALATRFVLPGLIDPEPRDVAASAWLARAWSRLARWPRLNRTACVALAAVAFAIAWWAPGAFWQNDLARLTPAPAAMLERDAQLRRELGAPDVRYVIAVTSADAEGALQALEQLHPALDALRVDGRIGGYDSAARYLPSRALQRARQAKLPERKALQRAFAGAVATSAFAPDAFAGFVDDVQAARAAIPLTPRDLEDTPLAATVAGLLLERGDHATALVSLSGLRDPAAVARVASAHGAQLLDLKQASESLVAGYRQRVLWALALASLLLVVTVWVALRQPRRVLRVLAPMALTTLLLLATLRGFGVELNLFHLVALILAAGLGLDYALFFDHAGDDRAEQLRTLHALIVCSLTTLLVFSLLALSSIPVLRAIGTTVALGVFCNFVLALLVTRQFARDEPSTVDAATTLESP
ncbi:MMPL family transporter [Lysobacter solisilvae (ex Woo and Kim 2020)]|uniref:MMPL family transporter n=1 Tax=Agrilutibacter terrestris TaxID=2865112 RepID=A0A7H0FU32_9GAMM|nr:MMPL family transporter [Lysobacter terrestris]QNP39548.1 MMPL family transporter [Lysobacter terrestris]